MTTTPGFLSGSLGGTQNLYTITYPLADIQGTLIGNVSKATTAVVTTQTTLPVTFVDGNQVLVTGVAGMTQLATAGINSSRVFYANVISSNTFGLYTGATLTGNVNSTSFSNATANTGSVSFFTVPQYNTVSDGQNVVFDIQDDAVGVDIVLDGATGVITLATDLSYSLSATVNTTMPLSPDTEAGYQWFNITADTSVGPFVKFGQTCTVLLSPAEESDIALKVYANESTFTYPDQITSASFTAQVIGGYTV